MKVPAGYKPATMVILILAISLPISAHPIHGLDFLHNVQDELALTDEQVTELEEIHWEARSEEIEKRAQLERVELEFQKLMDSDEFVETDIMRAFERVATARMELEKIAIKRRLHIKRILSADQEDELKRLIKERKPHPHRKPTHRMR